MDLNDQLLQLKTNKNGGTYLNGKPLDIEKREEIIRRYNEGARVTEIGRELQISHGVVSKIIQTYKKTHSILPKVRSKPYERKKSSKKKSPLKFSVQSILSMSPLKKSMSSESKTINKNRGTFTKEQSEVLKDYFKLYPLPDVTIKQVLSENTGLSVKQITTWFNNRRSRFRKGIANGNVTHP